jgi:hypothetical protein
MNVTFVSNVISYHWRTISLPAMRYAGALCRVMLLAASPGRPELLD